MTDRHPFPTRRSGKLAAALALLLGAFAPALAVTVTFREGANGYTGCQDTLLQQNPPNAGTNNGALASWGWDGDDPAGSGFDQYTLLRFDGIVGNGAGQIPPGATITSATLTYTVFDVGDPANLHPILTSWTEGSTYTSFCGGGGCLEGSQFGPAAGSATATASGAVAVSVTATVQAWASGGTNLGWFFFPTAGGGVDVRSSEHATVGERPLLTVVYNEGGPTSNLVRKPYLQMPTPTSMTLVWRTDVATDSRVRYGTVAGTLDQTVTVPATVVNHVVTLSGLTPATRYYYDVGSSAGVQGGGTTEHYFDTAPVVGSSAPFNVWVLGDSGTGDANQTAVRDAMLAFTAADPPEMMVHLGDIAYTGGTEEEFTTKHFTPYENIARHMPQWPTLGNHEGASTTSGAPGPSSGPYYDAFVLPSSGQAGGVSSGTEAYYSFDYANVHFIVLNSYQVSRSATGAMANWLQSDLAATTQQWIVAYWHHPPYSRGTHNSDTEIELIQMRENLLPILEAGGVDLVLSGHSHSYERSYLIDGTYSTPTPGFAALEAAGNVLDDGDGRPTGDGAYHKGSGQVANDGAVYVVAGHGGAATGGALNHPVMYYSETNHGSGILEVNGNSLTFRNLRATGLVTDHFVIEKGPQPPRLQSTSPPKLAVVSSLPSVSVTFNVPVSGVDAGDLTVDGSAATSLSCPTCTAGVGAGPYTFTGYATPGAAASTVVTVALATGGILDAGNPSLAFEGDTWAITIDPTPPVVADVTPARNTEVGQLASVAVLFSKGVVNVTPDDLTVNGSPATQVSGLSGSAGPYTFTGYAPPGPGAVDVVLAAGGIQDDQAQPFSGDSWSYALRRQLVINEFLASNNTAAQDENGEFDDYLEVYNPSTSAVDMSGMYLTDSLGFPNQYRIPDGVVIPAGGHLVFWCDGQTAQGPLHTNFNLLRTGEDIGLFGTDADGFPAVDTLSYATQTTDVAFGRYPDGSATFQSMPETPGATNTIGCSTDPECAALADACNTAACVGGLCQRQAANEGLACDDGIACLAGSSCTSGTCGGGASTCTGSDTCNVVSGQCEAPPPAPSLPIGVGATWSYFKGTVEPPADWMDLGFDASTWLSGASGFGFGPDCAGQRGTTLADMSGGYQALFSRREFSVSNPGLVTSLELTVDYDDAIVAYLNGTEVWRSASMGGTIGVPPPINHTPADTDHECSAPTGTTSGPNPPDVIDLTASIPLLQAGVNVLAVRGQNGGPTSSDFTMLATLTATQGTSCTTNAQCNDDNLCTDDVCSGGVCSNTADDTNACSDGVACTTDACSAGACVSTPACPAGQTCNLQSGICSAAAVTLTFQQGVSGYAGAQDTYLSQAAPGTANGAATSWRWDQDNPASSNNDEVGLIRFDGIFGNGAGQIPAGSTIQTATLTVNVTNGSVVPAGEVRPATVDWSAATATWTNFGGDAGVQADEYGALVAAAPLPTGLQAIAVTSAVQTWSANPAVNFGWVFLPGSPDGVQVDASEAATAANRPSLSVTFFPAAAGCTGDPECDDGNACNGTETCVSQVCQAGTALVCNDGNPCTTDSCNPASGCVIAVVPDGTSCSDGDACDGVELCQAGACAPGTSLVCNDGLACTSDTCVPASGCVFTSTCAPGQVCSLSTGLCETPAAPPLPIEQGDLWRYFKGSVEPPATWSALGFDDTSWLQGPGGFGYGSDCASSRDTTLADMLNGYGSLYARRAFHVQNPAAVSSMTLTVDHDDAFVAYLNGQEVGRSANIVGNPPAHNALATADHECSGSPTPNPPQVIDLTPFLGSLEAGVNVFAIQGHNLTLGSTDFTLAVTLTATEVQGPQGVLSCALSAPSAQAGTSVPMTVRLENVGALPPVRAYQTQIAITRTSGAGTVAVSCPGGVEVDEGVPDYLFAGRSDDFPAVNCPLLRAASALASGDVAAPADAYLAGYTLDVLPDATPGSTFEIAVLPFPDSALANAASDPLAFSTGPSCVLTVEAPTGCTSDPQCDDSNPCTDDTCQTGTCVHTDNTDPCDDGNACTTGDACSGGACTGTAISCDDADPCTLDTCSGGACVHAANGACGVSGTVRYYRDNVGGIEPSTKPVPNVQVDVDEDSTSDATTNASGGYVAAGLSGRVVTEPLPRYGVPRAYENNGAISSFDASLIAQRAVENITLTASQSLAADVTGNGTITSFDAAQVSQFAVELIDHFPVATATGSDWRFLPSAYVHDPLAGAETDDFAALLYGDVSGNWTAAPAFAASFTEEAEERARRSDRGLAESLAGIARGVKPVSRGAATLRVEGEALRLRSGERQTIAVRLDEADGIEGLDLAIRYDPRRLSVVEVRRGTLGAAFQMVHRDAEGVLRVGLFGLQPLAGSGELLLITVEGRGRGSARTPFRIEAEANEGAIPVRVEGR